jgi:hypothetical protein
MTKLRSLILIALLAIGLSAASSARTLTPAEATTNCNGCIVDFQTQVANYAYVSGYQFNTYTEFQFWVGSTGVGTSTPYLLYHSSGNSNYQHAFYVYATLTYPGTVYSTTLYVQGNSTGWVQLNTVMSLPAGTYTLTVQSDAPFSATLEDIFR